MLFISDYSNLTGFNDSAQCKILQKVISGKWVVLCRQIEVMKLIVFAVFWWTCPRVKHTAEQFIPIICCQFLNNQTQWPELPRRASLLIHFLTSIMLLCPPPTQCILNMTWHMCCMIKLKQLNEHLFYILFCPSARKPNFSLIVKCHQHQYCILLMWCIYYWFLDVFHFVTCSVA
jgi:hypothetical protein